MRRQAILRSAALAAAGAIAVVMLTARGQGSDSLSQWPEHEFDFARLVYSSSGYGRFRGTWDVDYPSAEFFFHKGVSRLSRVDMGETGQTAYSGETGVLIELDDDSLFNYPWLYAVEVGHWQLSDYEAERLREYLLRGGFLMVDDFHGSQEWLVFIDSMNRVFPDRPIVDIEDGHEILHVVYDVDERIQIPGISPLMSGRTYEQDGVEPHWRGIYDDDDRLMVMINHNMDLGDAWEHADDIRYPQEMTTLALHFAVNYVIYAMTH
ncbi:MAG: DUF4159 domain-containing protein [Gammaproteobacteria bacterium]|jgi:hypothetical protein